MCHFTLVHHHACGHSGLLTESANTLLCAWAEEQVHVLQAWDAAPACCHPLPIPEDNPIATVHTLFDVCDDCKPSVLGEVAASSESKKDLILNRSALKEDLDFKVYGQDDADTMVRLRELINETTIYMKKIAIEFEDSYNHDTTQLNLRYPLSQHGPGKHEPLFLEPLRQCEQYLNTMDAFILHHVPRRIFEDLARFAEKKIERVAERAYLLKAIGEYIKEEQGTGDYREAIKHLSDEIFGFIWQERTGTEPVRSAEDFGYLNCPLENEAERESCAKKEAKRLLETQVATERNVPAKRNDAGSALNDFPIRRGDYTALSVMSTAQFTNEKLSKIIRQRDLKFTVTNVPLSRWDAVEEDRPEKSDWSTLTKGLPGETEQGSCKKDHYESNFSESLKDNFHPNANQQSPKEDHNAAEKTANGSKLLAEEPASDIEVKYEPFSEEDIKVLVLRPDGSVPKEVPIASFCKRFCLDYPDDEEDEANVVAKQATSELETADVGRSYGLNDDYSDNDDDVIDGDVGDHEADEDGATEKSDSEMSDT